MYYSINI